MPTNASMTDDLKQPVGPGKANLPQDVRLVQKLLDRQAARTGSFVPQNGTFDLATQTALFNFQTRIMHMTFPNSSVSPHDETLRQLSLTAAQRLMAGAAGGLRLPRRIGASTLSEEDYQAAAADLGCEVRAIKAVTKVESPRGAFDTLDRPSILFERHIFHRYTGGKHDKTDPNISNKLRGGYGLFSAQYDRLKRAYALDATAALRSASWGAFQIMGFNFDQAGFGTVDLFVTAMCQSAPQQLNAFVAVIKSMKLTKAIQNKQWATFALTYNGPAYRDNKYDINLETAYAAAKP